LKKKKKEKRVKMAPRSESESERRPLLRDERDVERRLSYSTLSDLSPSISDEDISESQDTRSLLIGLFTTAFAGLCFTSGNTMVKLLPPGSSYDILLLRSLIQMQLMLPLVIRADSGFYGSEDWSTRWRVVAQGAMGGFLLLSVMQAVSRLPLGDSTAIFFSSPAITMILSFFLLKDHCGVWRIAVAALGITGVVVVARPPGLFPPEVPINALIADLSGFHLTKSQPPEQDFTGILWALAVPVLSATINIITRQAKHVHYSVFVFWFALSGLVVSISGLSWDMHDPFQNWTAMHWVFGLTASFVGVIGRVLFTTALSYITPTQVSVVLCLEVVVAFLIQVTIFHDPAHWTDLLGAMCILLAVTGMGFESKVMEKIRCRFM